MNVSVKTPIESKLQMNDCGVYVSGYYTTKLDTGKCSIEIKTGYDSKWGCSYHFDGHNEGRGYHISKSDLQFSSKKEAEDSIINELVLMLEQYIKNEPFKSAIYSPLIESLREMQSTTQLFLF